MFVKLIKTVTVCLTRTVILPSEIKQLSEELSLYKAKTRKACNRVVKIVQETTLNPFFKDGGKAAKEALNYSGDASKIAHAFKQLSIKQK